MDLELSGKRILITGSYRGTGAGLARVMAREGATVWVHGFELAPAEAVAQSIRDEGFEAHAVEGDIRTDEGAAKVASGVGEIDVLVNNYGVAEGGTIRSGAMNSPPRIGGADCKKSSISSAVTSGTTKS